MTWNIVTEPKKSSYITQYNIYINQSFHARISRKDFGIQYNIIGLRPNRAYTVGIEAVDGSLGRSTVKYKHFVTIEAGKFTRK